MDQVKKHPKAKKMHHGPDLWIQEAVKHMRHGAFTAQAIRHHETPLEYAKDVLAHPDRHTLTTRRRAQFLMNVHKK